MRELVGQWRLAMAVTLVVSVVSYPQNPTTRPNPVIGDTIKQLTDQLMDVNTSSQMTYDTRTPPKVRQQVIKRDRNEIKYEDSHPGVAEPIDEEVLVLDEPTKKTNYYKVDKATTDSGLSTWILLSGQGSMSTKPPKKNVTTTFITDEINKIIKPIFKRKLSTTKKPTTMISTTLQANIVTSTTSMPEKTTKLTKVKASLLNNIGKNVTHSTKKPVAAKLTKITTEMPISTEATTKKVATETTTKKVTNVANKKTTEAPLKKTTEYVKVAMSTTNETIESNSVLGPEAKEGTLDLTPVNKKSRKPVVATTTVSTIKKKKNKNRRKRPSADDKSDNGNHTKISKHKEKPIGTQIYNYLSREVMPTVGVGLVGLMVTAGLASYFLYPFAPLRRSYDIDRKDKVAPYYYHDEYSGGIAEEDAIGKVIAGMPTTTTTQNVYNRAQNSRNTFQNRYRQVDQRYMQGSVETVHLNPHTTYKIEEVIIGSPKKGFEHNSFNDVNVKSDEGEKKFVVGNIPKELQESVESATPAVVPEHGPRNMEKEDVFVVHSVAAKETSTEANKIGPRKIRRRRRRQAENEIDNDIHHQDDTYTRINTIDTTTPTTIRRHDTTPYKPETTTRHPLLEKTESIIDLIKDLFFYKLRLGLQILQNKTETLSRYFKTVQERIDDSFREHHRNQM